MADSANPYLFLVIFAIAAAGFAVGPLVLARLWALKFSPQKSGAVKNATYECGLEAKGDAWVQFKPEYYLYGILFLVFDVELLFLYPWAVAAYRIGPEAVWTSAFGPLVFAEIMVFIVSLAVAYVYAWRKGVFQWR